jgi:hypothetical protein
LTPLVREDIHLSLPAHPRCDSNGEPKCPASREGVPGFDRQPAQKRDSWRDLLSIKQKIRDNINNPPSNIIKQIREGLELKPDNSFRKNNTDIINTHFGSKVVSCSYNGISREEITIDKSGFFIAAPKTHFNLKGLTQKSKFGFFNVLTVTVPKDPIVFEYCKNGICRIITKWGTSDDQSYLDPALTNEIYN